MYRVLKPIYEKTPETFQSEGKTFNWFRVRWMEIGTALSYAEARARFGGRPVLESLTPNWPGFAQNVAGKRLEQTGSM